MLKKVLFPAIFVLMITWGHIFASGIIVPFYIYPTAQALQPILNAKAANPQVPIRVILNPDSGVGPSIDPNYVNAVQTLQDAGIEVAGYVDTNYNARPLSDVISEIELWKSWYNPNGIFLDRMGTQPCYYSTATQFTKCIGMSFTVGNPGGDVPTSYSSEVDTVVIAESPTLPALSSYSNWQNAGLPKSSAAMLVYGISALPSDFIKAAESFVGWFYVTDNNTSNPWDTLPSYFAQLVSLMNQSPVGVLVPFYVYPTGAAIEPLISTAGEYPNVPIRVILNPNSGVGSSSDPTYVNASAVLKKANISVAGYIYTSYGTRPLADVTQEIDLWVSWYQPNGIFLDEMGLNHTYYSSVTQYAKSKGIQYVIGNPGANIDTSAGQDVDYLNVYEDSSLPTLSDYSVWSAAGYYPDKIGFISYAIPTLPTTFVQQAANVFGWMYITNAGSGNGNPYDVLSAYFNPLVGLINSTETNQ